LERVRDARRQLTARFACMVFNQLGGQRAIAAPNCLGYGGVFVPDGLALLGRLQPRAHGASQVVPVLLRRLCHHGVAGTVVNGLLTGQRRFGSWR